VQPDGHHPRAVTGGRLVAQVVHAEPQVLEEVVRGGVGRAEQVADVVVDLGVRHDQERRGRPALAGRRVHEVGQLVVGGVGVVQEAALGDDQLAGTDAGERPAVPAGRVLAGQLGQHGHPAVQVLALLFQRHLGVLGPPVAVPEHVVPGLGDPLGDLGVALEAAGAGADRDRGAETVEEPGQPPHPGPAAELEVRLGAQVPDVRADLVGVLAPAVVAAVAVQQ
jgi:hypothetical protein